MKEITKYDNAGPFTFLVKEPKKYDAYVYKAKNKTKKNKKYLGYHVGKPDGTYLHSSEDEEFQIDFANSKNDFEMQVLAFGSKIEMATLEYEMLTEVDAKNNPEYYNKSNGGGMYVKRTKYKKVEELWQNIMNKKFPIIMEDKTKIKDMERFQVRVANTDPDHLRTLTDIMMDLHGDLKEWEPVHVLEDYNDDNSDLMINGNHTTISANNVDHVLEMPVMYIPKHIWSQFDEIELITLANLLNPQPEKPAKKSDPEDWIQLFIKKFYDKQIPVDSDENKKLLKYNGFTTRKITSAIKKAENEIEDKKLIPPGMQLKVYTDKDIKDIVETSSDKDTTSYVESSALFKMDKLLDKFDAIINSGLTKRHVIIHLRHPSMKSKKEWDKKWSAKVNTRIERISESYGNEKFHVNIQELNHLEKNTL